MDELTLDIHAGRPFHLAAVGGIFNDLQVADRAQIMSALILADRVNVLLADDRYAAHIKTHSLRPMTDRISSLRQFFEDAGCMDRVSIVSFSAMSDVQDYLLTSPVLDLVITSQYYFGSLDRWNDNRKSKGLSEYNILQRAQSDVLPSFVTSESNRAFRLASVGGTFNKLHIGHSSYLITALTLADEVHVFIASGRYAKERKTYKPRSLYNRRRSLKAFLKSSGTLDRVTIDTLNHPAEMQQYAEATKDLDLVIVEHTYFAWFDEWNEHRIKNGLSGYNILCRPRLTIQGQDISSSLWASAESRSSVSPRRPPPRDLLAEL